MLLEQSIHTFFDAVNRRDMETFHKLLADDARFHFPKTQPLVGRERILKFLAILFKQYPELAFRIQRVIVQENQAAVHWTNRGKNRKGEPYQNEGVTLLEFQGERPH